MNVVICDSNRHVIVSVAWYTYTVCPESKCTDSPMDELAMWHLVDVYQRIGSDLGCMLNVVSTGSAQSVVCYLCLCVVMFCNLITFAMQGNIE